MLTDKGSNAAGKVASIVAGMRTGATRPTTWTWYQGGMPV